MLFCDFCLVFLVLSEMCTELYISDDRLVKYIVRHNMNAAHLSVPPSPRRANPKCPRTTSHRCRSAPYMSTLELCPFQFKVRYLRNDARPKTRK